MLKKRPLRHARRTASVVAMRPRRDTQADSHDCPTACSLLTRRPTGGDGADWFIAGEGSIAAVRNDLSASPRRQSDEGVDGRAVLQKADRTIGQHSVSSAGMEGVHVLAVGAVDRDGTGDRSSRWVEAADRNVGAGVRPGTVF